MRTLGVTKQELCDVFGEKLGTIDESKIMEEITKYTFSEIERIIELSVAIKLIN